MRNKTVFPLDNKKAPAVKKGSSWQNYEGEADTPMVGVAIPKGIVVIDLDTYKGVKREDVERELGCELPWDDAIAQTTVNGGEHYAFEVSEDSDIKNAKNLFDIDGFDTRSAGKGYIATGEGYGDETLIGLIDALHTEGYFPQLPSQAAEKLSSNVNRSADADDFDALVSAQPLDISVEEVDMYLSRLTPAHADDNWLTVMMGIYHQFSGSEEGWERADTFSQLCMDKYNKRKNRARWESFGRNLPDKPITFASIIEMVGGVTAIVEEKAVSLVDRIESCESKSELQEIIKDVANTKFDKINLLVITKTLAATFKKVTNTSITTAQISKMLKASRKRVEKKGDYVDEYVFLTGTGEYMNRENKTVMGPRSFDVAMGRLTPADDEGNDVPATAYARDRIEVVHMGMYAPHLSGSNSDVFEYDDVKYANTYIPSKLERVRAGTTDIVERVKGHVAHLLDEERERDIFINYLAHNVQHPGYKIPWAVLLQGVEGDGKSFFAEMMKHIMGHHNSKSIGAEALEEKFTPWAEGSCLVFVEEVKLDNVRKHEVLNKLKPYITNPVVSVRKMRTDVYEAINTTNYIAFTNFQDALPIGDNDRRYAILFSRWQDKAQLERWMDDNPNYYQDLYADMRENAGEILDWLLSHDIPDSFKAMSRAPDTDAKRRMVDMGKSDASLLVEDAIATHECWDINDRVVNITKLARLATCRFTEGNDINAVDDFPKTSRLRNIMLELGYHAIGRYKDKDRKNNSLYAKDPNAKAADFANEDKDWIPF